MEKTGNLQKSPRFAELSLEEVKSHGISSPLEEESEAAWSCCRGTRLVDALDHAQVDTKL